MQDPVVAAKMAECVAYFHGPDFDAVGLIEQHLGRYTRGARKGLLRGWARVITCVEGGWVKDAPGGHGHVCRPGTLVGVEFYDRFSGKTYLKVGR